MEFDEEKIHRLAYKIYCDEIDKYNEKIRYKRGPDDSWVRKIIYHAFVYEIKYGGSLCEYIETAKQLLRKKKIDKLISMMI